MKHFIQILIFLCYAPTLFAQTPLDKEIDFEAQNISLEQALLQLVKNQDVPLAFSNNLIPDDILVTIKVENQRIDDLLKSLLEKTELSWQLIGNQIVIIKLPYDKRPKYTLSGFIENAETGERVIGASVFAPELFVGTVSNEFGFYSLSLPAGRHHIGYSYLGFERQYQENSIYENRENSVELKPLFLTEILVKPIADSLFLKSPDNSTDQFLIENIEQFTALGGEPDVVRLVHTLPGVQTGADGFGGFAVRGGSTDQNLFLLDGVPVYNSLHTLGLFSIYNSSAILKADFYKGVFPAKFGGRLSSILDVHTKEGNRKEGRIETDIGLTSIKLTAEGPLGRQKNASFFASGRRALFDFYSIPYTQRTRANKGVDGYLSYFFYDLNLKVNQKISKKDQIYLSVYHGVDNFKDVKNEVETIGDTSLFLMDYDTVLWGNTTASFRWNRKFSGKLFGNTTLTYSQFFYESDQFVDFHRFINQNQDSRAVLFLQYSSFNEDLAAKIDFQYYPNEQHEIDFGINATKHKFQPGIVNFTQIAEIESIDLDTVGKVDKASLLSYEIDAYFQDEIKFNKNIVGNIGLRASGLLVQNEWLISWQPRFLFKFFPQNQLSFKLSAGKHTQNLHLLSASTFGLPKDIWVSATPQRKPQQAWQFVGGFDFKFKNNLDLNVEAYYKNLRNLLVFNDVFIDRITVNNWESKVSSGKGEAYGLEFLLKKQTGKTTGWLSYTLGWADREFDIFINQGNPFATRLDRRHNLNIQLLHKINTKWNFSAGWVFSTGSAYTSPVSEYVINVEGGGDNPNIQLINVSEIPSINNRRLPNYHRLDLGLNYHFSKRKLKHNIKLGIYNAYFRKNPTYRTRREVLDENGGIRNEFVQVSLLPVFPTLRYSVVFL